MASDQVRLQDFLDLSVELTAFSAFKLRGTGYAEKYFDTLQTVVGRDLATEILQTFRALVKEAGDDSEKKKQLIRTRLMSSTQLGPIVRNIIKMWYVSTWYELPQEWRDAYGTPPHDGTFVVDAWAYPEGLLWPAVGAHPPGAKAPGYGTWTEAPKILDIPSH